MSNRIKRLLVISTIVCAGGIYWGCTQPSDVIVSLSSSEVTLTPQLLPTNFPGMHYELWVANRSDTVSLGKFGYSNVAKRFLEIDGTARLAENHFELADNIYRFVTIFVSVERDADPYPKSPGPIMLIDDITNPSNSSVDLAFPEHNSLWEATCRYNMETTSDSNRFAKDGYGIWFTSYQRLNDSVRDTFSLDSFWVDSAYSTFLRDTVVINLINISNIAGKDTTRIFGVDSRTQHVIRYKRDFEYDTAAAQESVLVTTPGFRYTIGGVFRFDYDEFTQDSFALPDYSGDGWKYKGWVVSGEVSPSLVGKITPPAWRATALNDSMIPALNGGLLTTGTFTRINAPDDGNPYAESNRLPQFPGEDFLLFPDSTSWNGLTPNGSGNSGTVFITLEPTNFVSDTTNFPLFAFIGKVPKNQSTITADIVIINMLNRTQIDDPAIGFPRIRVAIKAQ